MSAGDSTRSSSSGKRPSLLSMFDPPESTSSSDASPGSTQTSSSSSQVSINIPPDHSPSLDDSSRVSPNNGITSTSSLPSRTTPPPKLNLTTSATNDKGESSNSVQSSEANNDFGTQLQSVVVQPPTPTSESMMKGVSSSKSLQSSGSLSTMFNSGTSKKRSSPVTSNPPSPRQSVGSPWSPPPLGASITASNSSLASAALRQALAASAATSSPTTSLTSGSSSNAPDPPTPSFSSRDVRRASITQQQQPKSLTRQASGETSRSAVMAAYRALPTGSVTFSGSTEVEERKAMTASMFQPPEPSAGSRRDSSVSALSEATGDTPSSDLPTKRSTRADAEAAAVVAHHEAAMETRAARTGNRTTKSSDKTPQGSPSTLDDKSTAKTLSPPLPSLKNSRPKTVALTGDDAGASTSTDDVEIVVTAPSGIKRSPSLPDLQSLDQELFANDLGKFMSVSSYISKSVNNGYASLESLVDSLGSRISEGHASVRSMYPKSARSMRSGIVSPRSAASLSNGMPPQDPDSPTWAERLGCSSRRKGSNKLGTFRGVFVPCVQQMLGISIFVRLPFVVGAAGVGYALLIVALATASTVLTTLSLSAIVSNGNVTSGGIYRMMTRVLGTEISAAITLVFSLGASISIAFFILGAVEVLRIAVPSLSITGTNWDQQIISYVVLLVLLLMVVGNIRLVSNYGAALLLFTTVGLLSMGVGVVLAPANAEDSRVTGLSWVTFTDNWGSSLSDTVGFSTVLTLFYPSVTGILTGTNRLGSLATPETSVPRGTSAAIFTTSALYFIWVALYGAVASRDLLTDLTTFFPAELGWPVRGLVISGAVLSALGAALQNLITAPRMFRAMANDKSVPFLSFMHRPKKKFGSLAASTATTAIVVALFILPGDIDSVAPFFSMFLLMAYLGVNASCFLLAILKAPSFRPAFQGFHWSTALAGAVVPFVIMFTINWFFALATLGLTLGAYKYVQYKRVAAFWGDGLLGLRYEAARNGLIELSQAADLLRAKSWRPQILALLALDQHDNPRNPNFLTFLSQLEKGNGMLILGSVLVGKTEACVPHLNNVNNNLSVFMKQQNVSGTFVQAVCAPSLLAGVSSLIQVSGLGGLTPNMVALGWPRGWKKGEWDSGLGFMRALQEAKLFSKAVMVVRNPDAMPDNSVALTGTIDVWWLLHDGGLLLLLPHILLKHKVWRGCHLRVFAVASLMDNSVAMERALKHFLRQVRISADVHVVEMYEQDDIQAYQQDQTIRHMDRQRVLQKSALPSSEIGAPLPREIISVGSSQRGTNSAASSSSSLDTTTESVQSGASVVVPDSLRVLALLNDQKEKGQGLTGSKSMPTLANGHKPPGGSPSLSSANPENTPPPPKAQSATVQGAERAARSGSAPAAPPGLHFDKMTEAPIRSVPASEPTESSTAPSLPAVPQVMEPSDEGRRMSAVERVAAVAAAAGAMSRSPSMVAEGKRPAGLTTAPRAADMLSVPNAAPHSRRSSIASIESTFGDSIGSAAHSTVTAGVGSAPHRLNQAILEHSSEASLVFINLPAPKNTRSTEFLEYVETMTEGLPRVVLLRGTGEEVVSLS